MRRRRRADTRPRLIPNHLPLVPPMTLPATDSAAVQTGRRPRAIILGFGGRPNILREALRLEPVVAAHMEIVASDFTGTMDLTAIEADVAVVFGGDGSILRAAHQMGKRQLPVIAVNLGKLGFLADLGPAELAGALEDFRHGKLTIVDHLMFDCCIFRRGACSATSWGQRGGPS